MKGVSADLFILVALPLIVALMVVLMVLDALPQEPK